MKNRNLGKLFLSALMVMSGLSCASEIDSSMPSGIPLSVDEVQTFRVGRHLVRLIRHNMELVARFDIELLATPELKLVDRLSISEVEVDGETLDFDGSQGVFVERFGVEASSVNIEFEYFYADGGSDIVICESAIEEREIGVPDCKLD